MRYLLDTCTLIWLSSKPEAVPASIKNLLSVASERHVSVASYWEIQIKSAKGSLNLETSLDTFFRGAFTSLNIAGWLPIDISATRFLDTLPTPHNDPFDRILVCQALCHQLTLVSPDKIFEQYPITVLW